MNKFWNKVNDIITDLMIIITSIVVIIAMIALTLLSIGMIAFSIPVLLYMGLHMIFAIGLGIPLAVVGFILTVGLVRFEKHYIGGFLWGH